VGKRGKQELAFSLAKGGRTDQEKLEMGKGKQGFRKAISTRGPGGSFSVREGGRLTEGKKSLTTRKRRTNHRGKKTAGKEKPYLLGKKNMNKKDR